MFAAIAELTSIRSQMQETQLTLASLFDLVSMLLRLGGSESALDGNFITDTNQVGHKNFVGLRVTEILFFFRPSQIVWLGRHRSPTIQHEL